MPTPVFSFPFHETIDSYPASSQAIKFGSGYEFASRPVGPDQLTFTLKFPGMWWYESAGAVDYVSNPTRNMGTFTKFYESVRCSDWFTYAHPRRGTITCRFNKPLVTPRILPNSNGLTEPFDVEIILQPVLATGDLQLTEEATDLIAAMSTAPNVTRQALIDYTIRKLKAAGVWKLIDCLYVHAAATKQAGQLNWKNPGPNHTLVEVGSPDFNADNGFLGTDDTASNSLTGPLFTSGSQLLQDSASVFTWVTNNTQSANGCIGAITTVLLRPRNLSDAMLWRINCSTSVTVNGVTNSKGLHTLVRDGSTASRFYKNGSQIGSDSAIVSVAVGATFRVAAEGTAASGGHRVALSGFGKAFTYQQQLNFYNIMREYLLAVGLSV